MKPDYRSSQSAAKATQFKEKTGLNAHVVNAKLGFFFGELAITLLAILFCMLIAKEAKLENDSLQLVLSRIGLMAAIWFLVCQLAAVIRLVKFGGACVVDRNFFKHFSVGILPWSAIHSAILTETDVTPGRSGWGPDSGWGLVIDRVSFWDPDDDREKIQTFLVLTLDRNALRAVRPGLISRLIVRRYTRFDVESSVIKLACDSLDEGPGHLLWHIQQRIQDKQNQYVG